MFTQNIYQDHIFKDQKQESLQVSQVDFIDCRFIHCVFPNSVFSACCFNQCLFSDCDLSLLQVDNSAFINNEFVRCKLVGINWAKAAWGSRNRSLLVKPLQFHECVLDFSVFIGLDLEKIVIRDCKAREVDFSEANLQHANFQNTVLTKSKFRKVDLRSANFIGAKDYDIHPHLALLDKARFSLPEALSLLYNLEIEIVDVDN